MTEGIILRRSNYGEADRVLTVLTPFKGKVKYVAKGVRRISSRRAGNVELLNKVRLHIFQARGMGVITEAESLKTYQKLKSSIVLCTYASYVAELVEKFLAEEQTNYGVYQLVIQLFEVLEQQPRQIYIRAFEVKLLTELGFWSGDQIMVDDSIAQLLSDLQLKSWSEIAKIEIDPVAGLELERVLGYYIDKILETPIKSRELIQKLKENN